MFAGDGQKRRTTHRRTERSAEPMVNCGVCVGRVGHRVINR